MILATWEEREIGAVYHDQVVDLPDGTKAPGLSLKIVREATIAEYLAQCPNREGNLNGVTHFYEIHTD